MSPSPSHYQLFRITADSEDQLNDALEKALTTKTLNADLGHGKHSVSILYTNPEQCRERIQHAYESISDHSQSYDKDNDRICFLFTGQGAQYAGMSRALYQAVPYYKNKLEYYASYVKEHTLIDCLPCLIGDDEKINQTLYTQPCLVIMQLALYDLFKCIDVPGDMIIGHSVGEFSGSACSGAYAVDTVLSMIGKRASLMQSVNVDGGMIAIASERDTIQSILDNESIHLNYAAFNAPKQIVLAGETTEIARMHQHCKNHKIKSRILTVSHPFHSELMHPITDRFVDYCKTLPGKSALEIPLISNLTAAVIKESQSAEYWGQHILKPVQFDQSVQYAWQMGAKIFIEIGPDAILSKLAKKCLADEQAVFVPSQRKGADGVVQLIHTVEILDRHGASVNWSKFLQLINN